MINSSIHLEFQAWLEQTIQNQAIQRPQPHIYQHIANCDHCRGMVILAAQSYPQLFPNPSAYTCDQACDDLPSLIDDEQSQAHQAIQRFPELWWHLLACDACAELYAQLRIALEAERSNTLTAPKIFMSTQQASMPATLATQLLQASDSNYRLTFAREFLNQALQIAPQLSQRRYRSNVDTHEQIKILEDNPDLQIGTVSYHFKVWIKTSIDSWSLVASLEPALAGWLTIQLGAHNYRQKFDYQGISTLNQLPNDQLLSNDGPALTLAIDPLID